MVTSMYIGQEGKDVCACVFVCGGGGGGGAGGRIEGLDNTFHKKK